MEGRSYVVSRDKSRRVFYPTFNLRQQVEATSHGTTGLRLRVKRVEVPL